MPTLTPCWPTTSLQAMHLFQVGEYKKAYEIANINYSQFSRLNYVGCFAPLDSLFVMARCLLEFARPREAKAKFFHSLIFVDLSQWYLVRHYRSDNWQSIVRF